MLSFTEEESVTYRTFHLEETHKCLKRPASENSATNLDSSTSSAKKRRKTVPASPVDDSAQSSCALAQSKVKYKQQSLI